MGSSLGPFLADITINQFLDTIIPTLTFKLPFLYKYVDDIITVSYTHLDVYKRQHQ